MRFVFRSAPEIANAGPVYEIAQPAMSYIQPLESSLRISGLNNGNDGWINHPRPGQELAISASPSTKNRNPWLIHTIVVHTVDSNLDLCHLFIGPNCLLIGNHASVAPCIFIDTGSAVYFSYLRHQRMNCIFFAAVRVSPAAIPFPSIGKLNHRHQV